MPPSGKSSSTHYDSDSSGGSSRDRSSGGGRMTLFDWFIRLPIALLMFGFIFFYIVSGGNMTIEDAKKFFDKLPEVPGMFAEQIENNIEARREYEATAVQDSYYVEALGRYCDWDDEYECYYDPETDCYFWYNNTTQTHTWQYWYESISSDFGDYGWMEYDKSEGQWYIEESQGSWIVLPAEYDTGILWHIE